MKRFLFLIAGTLIGQGAVASAQEHTAFVVDAGQAGNQAFGGALGMEFNVISPVTITKLGCFDDLSDGLQLDIQVRLYDRTVPGDPMATLDFLIDDAGTAQREDGELAGGSRFLPLTTPINLPAGFQGMIVANNYGAGERNGNNGTAAPWTMDSGGGLISFTGRRAAYGAEDAYGYPNSLDGNSGKYAAGTFIFKANGATQPAPPTPTLTGGNAQVALAWEPVTAPAPAVSYRILRSASSAGPYSQIAEVNTTSFTDTPLVNGTTYYYKLISVAAGNVLSAESSPWASAPFLLGTDRHIAYFTPGNLPGNQIFGGSLGMDFDVQNAVTVTRLGVYDSNSDGIQPDPGADGIPGNEDDLPRILTARLYDRDTLEPLATLEFSAETPGTLVAGMRFLDLAEPLSLPAGFQGCMVADGYGAGEQLRNSFALPANQVWTLDDGNASLLFTGTSRYGTPGAFPETADASLAAGYAAGTFEYQTTAAIAPGKPVVHLVKRIEDASTTLAWDAVTLPAPAASYRVYLYDESDFSYTLAGQTTELSLHLTGLTNGAPYSFVVRGVSSGGTEGLSSDLLTTTPEALAAGVAYVVPEFTLGIQDFGGSLGMDFDVANPVTVTRLGAFDSGSDGLFQPITVGIYDRNTGEAVTPLVEFAVDDAGTPAREDGELREGSRFLSLASPVTLPAGFQGCIVAYGYGPLEPLGNPNAGEWTTFSGGSLVFVGKARYDVNTGVFPATVDGGPANRYAAGTFAFAPSSTVPAFDPNLSISLLTGSQVRLDWTVAAGAILQRSPSLSSNSWTDVPAATPGFVTNVNGREFFRLIQR